MEAVEVLAPNEKRCPRCERVRDRNEFSRDRSRKDGRGTYCKVCVSEWNRNNRDKYKIYQKRYIAKYNAWLKEA